MGLNNSMNRFLLTAACLAAACCAEAQTNISADKSIDLNPVIVTGTGTYRKAENSPVAVRVLSAKDLKDAQVSSLQDALTRLTTNITTHTSGMGTSVNFNGVSDEYIVILENGKRLSGDDRWNRISLDNVKRIEILSGAASALYGSDAIAGVINIITDESRENVSVANNTRMSSKGRLDEDINVDVNAGKFGSFTAFSHKQADNWQVNRYQAFEEGDETVMKLTGRPMSTGFHSNNISEKMTWTFNDKWDMYVRGNYYDYRTDRPQSATYFTQKKSVVDDGHNDDDDNGSKKYAYTYTAKNAYTYDLHHKSYNYGAGARWTPNKNTHIYLDLYSDNFSSKYDYWQTSEAEGYEEVRKRTHYYNETLKGIFRLSASNKLSAGAEFVQDYLNSASDNIDNEHTSTYNFFAQDEVQILDCLEGVAGVRYTYNDNFGSNVTPNAALFFHTGGLRLRASYAGGYRTPALSQLYATDQAKTAARYTISNPDLKPEKNDFWNVNAEYGNEWLNISVSGFINKIRDMINYRTMTQNEIDANAHLSEIQSEGWTTIRQRDNIDKAQIKGVSASVKFILPYGFTLGGGYTFTDSKAKTRTLNSMTQEYETTESPVDKSVRHIANVSVTWQRAWGNYRLNMNFNGHIQGERYSSTYGYAPKYQQWDLSTRHSFSLKNMTVEPGFGIENIFNKRDTSPWNSNFSTVNPGRAMVVSLRVSFEG